MPMIKPVTDQFMTSCPLVHTCSYASWCKIICITTFFLQDFPSLAASCPDLIYQKMELSILDASCRSVPFDLGMSPDNKTTIFMLVIISK